MAMGTRKQREKQEDIWIAHTELASAPGHPFYQRLNELLEGSSSTSLSKSAARSFIPPRMGGRR
jgi:transposase